MECSQTTPVQLPVIARNAVFDDRFDFSDASWQYVSHLGIIASEDSEMKAGLRQLQRNEFVKLSKLEHLKLRCNCLDDITEFAFAGLDELKVLDLSNKGRLFRNAIDSEWNKRSGNITDISGAVSFEY